MSWKKTLVSDAKAASGADQFKHRAKVVVHPEVLRVLNALPRHRPITVTALQGFLLVLGFCSCSCRGRAQPRAGLFVNSSARGGMCRARCPAGKIYGEENSECLMASPVHPSSQRGVWAGRGGPAMAELSGWDSVNKALGKAERESSFVPLLLGTPVLFPALFCCCVTLPSKSPFFQRENLQLKHL